VKRTGDLLPGFTCEHVEYQPTARLTSSGRVIYTTKASQQKPPAPAVKAARAHGGYADVQRSINHHMPRSLRNAHHLNREALRSLHRASKVRL
jgi:hypothetical protein